MSATWSLSPGNLEPSAGHIDDLPLPPDARESLATAREEEDGPIAPEAPKVPPTLETVTRRASTNGLRVAADRTRKSKSWSRPSWGRGANTTRR